MEDSISYLIKEKAMEKTMEKKIIKGISKSIIVTSLLLTGYSQAAFFDRLTSYIDLTPSLVMGPSSVYNNKINSQIRGNHSPETQVANAGTKATGIILSYMWKDE